MRNTIHERFLNLIQQTARQSDKLKSVIWNHSNHTFTLRWETGNETIKESDVTDSSFMIIYDAIHHRAFD